MRALMAAAGLLPASAASGQDTRSRASLCGTKADALRHVKQLFAELGFEPLANTPAEFSEQIKQGGDEGEGRPHCQHQSRIAPTEGDAMTMASTLTRRLFIATAFALACGTADHATAAEQYPSKPVHVMIGFAAGGPTDVVTRLVTQKLSESLKQQFVVENRPGAGSNIAMGMVARAVPDGYTLLAVSSAYVVNPTLYGAKVTYDPIKDFIPITVAADSPNAVFINPSVPAKTMKELIAAMKAEPGKYAIATAGMGTTPDLAAELLRMTFKLEAPRVPFNGGAPSVQSVLQGQTPVGFGAIPPATELIKTGQLRGLAVAAKRRSAALPDVPTMAEAGIPGQESNTFAAFLAPAGTPAPIVQLLHTEMVKALADPHVKSRLIELGFDPVGNSPAEFAALIKVEIEKWGKVIHAANMKIE